MKNLFLVALILSFALTVKSQAKEMFYDVSTVSYCELIKNAEKYDQKFVKVAATYSRGFESSIFFDDSCQNNEVSWVEFNSLNDFSNPKTVKSFRKIIERSYQDKPAEIKILVVGKFDAKRQISILKTKVKSFTFSSGYGHTNAFDHQLTVLKLEEIIVTQKK